MFMFNRRQCSLLYSPGRKSSFLLAAFLIIVVIPSSVSGRLIPNLSRVHAANLSWAECGKGCAGENVATIQLLLWTHNYATPLNGLFDSATINAIKAFQAASTLEVNGTVGQRTWPALIKKVQQGDRGLVVVALQRQLMAHGANLVPSGEFNQQTVSALQNYQLAQGLDTSGTADPSTWNNLVDTPAGTTLPPPPQFAHSKTLWGIDTAPPVTSSSLDRIIQKFGKPSFIGKYLHGTNFTPLSSEEASLIHSQGMRIMLLEPDFGKDTGYNHGADLAMRAVTRARELGIPQGVAIFADLEPGSQVDAGWLEAWYGVVLLSGYLPGYYANPYADRNFNGPFCAAVSQFPSLADKAVLDIYEPMLTRSPVAQAPLFAPSIPYCGSHPTGNVLMWQYGLSGGDSQANVDTDEMKASVPLW
jgi:peptidoglycan hydrolase-like protein with peptidoglycan-binding domain